MALRSLPKPKRRRPATEGRGREDLKRAILDAARRLCLSDGIDGVSARKIARAVGCSPTAIYLYYRNLDEVLHHLRMEGHGVLARYFGEVDAALPPRRRLRAMGEAYFRFGREHPNDYELMFLHRFKEMPGRELVSREIFTLMLVRDVVREGQDAGEIRRDVDPLVIANGVWSNMHGLTSLAIAGLLLQTASGQEQRLLDGVLESIDRWIAA
jgi:AcrR family transcriptional regulator